MARRAAFSPSQGTGSRRPKRASEGMTWTMLAKAMTGLASSLVPGEEDAGGDADGGGEEHGEEGEPEMLEGEASDLGGVVVEEGHRGCSGCPWSSLQNQLYGVVDGGDVGVDVGVGGLCRTSSGGEVGDDGALVEEDDAVGEVEGFVEVVGDEEGGLFELGEEVAEGGLDLGAGDGVEGSEGLV